MLKLEYVIFNEMSRFKQCLSHDLSCFCVVGSPPPPFTFLHPQTQAALSHPKSGQDRADSGLVDGPPEVSLREVKLFYISLCVHTQASITTRISQD